MHNPHHSSPELAALSAAATALFGQAAAAGRDSLNAQELGELVSSLALKFTHVPEDKSPAGELRISLNNTREFGMVLSAGLGGLDAQLDESNFRKDRASVYAAAELTDAEDFLKLFKRTLA